MRAQVTVPQHNYKLQLHTEARHAGEVDWRHYRASVLRTLPHAWRHGGDTRNWAALVRRQRPGRKWRGGRPAHPAGYGPSLERG